MKWKVRDTVEFYLHVQSHVLYSPMTGLTNMASLPKVDFNIQGLLHPRFLETKTSKKRDLFALLWNIFQSPSFPPRLPSLPALPTMTQQHLLTICRCTGLGTSDVAQNFSQESNYTHPHTEKEVC